MTMLSEISPRQVTTKQENSMEGQKNKNPESDAQKKNFPLRAGRRGLWVKPVLRVTFRGHVRVRRLRMWRIMGGDRATDNEHSGI
ncbi:hypothetical protein CEXT_340241 [Caerostris extrusa]|uniref:Uncharacterized protein n=1 Tax=Caerostris extrusa TaxID=172846 RepID=A0AAV4R5Z1_CAEEX|nr:hypothetical protein CEXT_340241 [Caerostris extrusa]